MGLMDGNIDIPCLGLKSMKKEVNMECPLLIADGCIKGKCAIWDKVLKQCVFISLLQAIRNLAEGGRR